MALIICGEKMMCSIIQVGACSLRQRFTGVIQLLSYRLGSGPKKSISSGSGVEHVQYCTFVLVFRRFSVWVATAAAAATAQFADTHDIKLMSDCVRASDR